MLKVRQVNPASRFAFLRSRLSAPHAVIGKPVSQVAQRDLRPEFRGKPRQAVRALPRALAATDADHNERIEGEAVAIVHAPNVHFSFSYRQVQSFEPVDHITVEFRKDMASRYRRAHRDFAAFVTEFSWIRDEAHHVAKGASGGLPTTLLAMFGEDAWIANLQSVAEEATASMSPYVR
jgi:hypothetical protein